MFYIKSIQKLVDRHHLTTAVSRAAMFIGAVFALVLFTHVNELQDERLNTILFFNNYQVGPKVAHFFKEMGDAYMSQENSTAVAKTRDQTTLFELDSKLNPVFLEHGELNVLCSYSYKMDLRCHYTGVIREPKYYIQEVSFYNSRPDVLRYNFKRTQSQNSLHHSYNSDDIYSRLAAYFFIFENPPGQLVRYPTLASIKSTKEFQQIRDRIHCVYNSVIAWTYLSHFTLIFVVVTYAISHLAIMATKILQVYHQQARAGGIAHSGQVRFIKNLEMFSCSQMLIGILCLLLHRLVILLTGVAQSFVFGSVSDGLTFNNTKTYAEGLSTIYNLCNILGLVCAFYAIHYISLAELTPKTEDEEQKANAEIEPPMQV